jgi:hypothetical protein
MVLLRKEDTITDGEKLGLFSSGKILCVFIAWKGEGSRQQQSWTILFRTKVIWNCFGMRRNWQSLCDSHHSRKTAKEDGGFGNN